MIVTDDSLVQARAKLLGSPALFTKFFFRERTGHEFAFSSPVGRESHHVEIFKQLTQLARASDGINTDVRLIINTPPRYSKTEIVIHFIAWALAKWPDCNFLYISYAHSLAAKATQVIRDILELASYKQLFRDTRIDPSSSAKDNFRTTAGGSVFAVGFGGAITGRGAGIKNCKRFGGAVFIDDAHKPSEAESDTIRESVIETFQNTIQSRLNDGDRTPMIYIGQRVHEHDLTSVLIADGWKHINFQALDEAGNALDPRMHTTEKLLQMKEQMPYVFSAQYQQDPIPSGGALYKHEWFTVLEDIPEITDTFITADTAETSNTYNDKTVFSFWGVHKIFYKGADTGEIGLHWINCVELQVEPCDLEGEFLRFYDNCMRYRVKPQFAAIEKKSTGVTLISVLKKIQGIRILEIERSSASGSKSNRLIEAQGFVSKKLISFPLGSSHYNFCVNHLAKITANGSHRYDDIADTMYDAIKLVFIDRYFDAKIKVADKRDDIFKAFIAKQAEVSRLKKDLGGSLFN